MSDTVKKAFIHATLTPDGKIYLPRSFLTTHGFPLKSKVEFSITEDGLSFMVIFRKGKLSNSNGLFKIPRNEAERIIRAVEENKGVDYPYQYKGVYALSTVSNSALVGNLVKNKVESIHLN